MTKDLSSYFAPLSKPMMLECESEDKTFSTHTKKRAKLLCVGFRVYIKKRESPPPFDFFSLNRKKHATTHQRAFYFSRDLSSFERGGKGGKGRGRGRGVEDDDSSRDLVFGDRDDDDSGRQRRRNGDEATAMFRGRFSTIIIIIIIIIIIVAQ